MIFGMSKLYFGPLNYDKVTKLWQFVNDDAFKSTFTDFI